METFTLVVWLYVGQIYEEVRIPNLGGEECVELVIKIHADRSRKFGTCIGTKGLVLPRSFLSQTPGCPTAGADWCRDPLPGRRRV